jgi:hypothetical protein
MRETQRIEMISAGSDGERGVMYDRVWSIRPVARSVRVSAGGLTDSRLLTLTHNAMRL